MDEEILLKRRLIDTANKAYRQNIYTYTNFLSMSELDTYYRTLPELSFIHSEAFGGSASCDGRLYVSEARTTLDLTNRIRLTVSKSRPCSANLPMTLPTAIF